MDLFLTPKLCRTIGRNNRDRVENDSDPRVGAMAEAPPEDKERSQQAADEERQTALRTLGTENLQVPRDTRGSTRTPLRVMAAVKKDISLSNVPQKRTESQKTRTPSHKSS